MRVGESRALAAPAWPPQTHSFAARQLGGLAAAGASDRASESGRTATAAAGAGCPRLQFRQLAVAPPILPGMLPARRLRAPPFAQRHQLRASTLRFSPTLEHACPCPQAPQPPTQTNSTHPTPHPPSPPSPGGDEAGLLQLMQQSTTDLLRRLRPDNFGAFAELFTAAVLQVGWARSLCWQPASHNARCQSAFPHARWRTRQLLCSRMPFRARWLASPLSPPRRASCRSTHDVLPP